MKTILNDDINIVELDLSTICNAKCPLCMRQSQLFPEIYKKPFFRQVDDIVEQLNKFKNLEYVYLIGQMSEPTLHPQFLDIINYLKSRNIKIKICTNGDTNNPIFWKKLGEMLNNDDRVWFGICGSTQELHAKYRIGTKLQNILLNSEILRSVRRIDGAKCIRFSYNDDDFNSSIFKKMIKRFSFVEYTETCYQDNNINDFSPRTEINKKYEQINTIAKTFNCISPGNLCQSKIEKSIQIDPYGNIFPCYRFLEMNSHNVDWEYNKIESGFYDCCVLCNKKVVEYVNRKGLNDII